MEKKTKRDRGWIYVLIGLLCVIVAVVAIIMFLLQGNTKTTSGGEIEVTEAVVCEGEGIPYSVINYNGSGKSSIKINAIYDGDKIETISLVYRIDYEDAEQAEQDNAAISLKMSKSLEEDSLSAESLGMHFSDLKNAKQISLYAKAKELNGVSAKYFMLDGVNSFKKNNVTKKLNEQGLDCNIQNKS